MRLNILTTAMLAGFCALVEHANAFAQTPAAPNAYLRGSPVPPEAKPAADAALNRLIDKAVRDERAYLAPLSKGKSVANCRSTMENVRQAKRPDLADLVDRVCAGITKQSN